MEPCKIHMSYHRKDASMKNKKLNNKKKLIIFIGILIIIIIVVLIIVLNNQNKEEKIEIVNYKEAEKLYQESNNKCTDIQDENDSLLLYLIFSKLDKESKLSDSIPYDEYENIAKTILKTDDIPSKINNYLYDGYSYTLEENKITRTKTECEEKYVSKIYGYSNDNNTLSLYISSGYVKDGKVYNLEGIEIGDYDKNKINKILDSGTIKIYNYKNENGKYILQNII